MNSSRFRLGSATLAVLLFTCLSFAQSYPPAWKSSATYAIGDQVQLNGNVLRATHAVTAGSFKYDDWELWDVRANTTIMIGVGQTFTSLQSAWTYVQNARVAEAVYLHLYISTAHGNLVDNFTGSFSLDHLSGARISILGDNAANIFMGGTAGFPAGNGFTLDSGHSFGAISNIQIKGYGYNDNPPSAGNAISLSNNASIGDLAGVEMSYWTDGVCAAQGSSVHISKTVTVTNSENGMEATQNGQISIDSGWTSSGIYLEALYAHLGGQISAEGCTISGAENGVHAEEGGIIDAAYCNISGCDVGANATLRGYINVAQGKFSSSPDYDVSCTNGSVMVISDATLSSKNIDSTGSYFID